MKTAIELAREAGFNQGIEELTAEEFAIAGVWVQDTEITELVEHLVELARADEREACCNLLEGMHVVGTGSHNYYLHAATELRRLRDTKGNK